MARKKAKVLDNPDLEKDLETGVIINNNKSNLINRKMVKRNILDKENDLQKYKDLCETLIQRLDAIEEKLQ
ncbi:hypothetical protein ABK046_44885 [Streptomyces caeruleatus]